MHSDRDNMILVELHDMLTKDQYDRLMDYIVDQKDEAYWDGVHAANEGQGGV